MKKLKQIISLLMAVLMLTAVLCGCADGKDSDKTTSPGEEASPGDNVKKSEIVVGIAQDLDDSLDPHKMTAAGTREVLFNVYEGLVKPDSDGNLVPAVAESYTINEETGDEFTFALRQGVKFHDGSTVTVGDIVYSISRAAGLDTGEPLISALAIISDVSATDDSTIVVKTSVPNIELIALIASAYIIPENSAEDGTLAGTGPFKFSSRSPQENFIIERFDDYWGEKAYLEKVTYKIFENAEAILMALKGGAVDLCAHLTSSQAAELSGFTILEGTMNLVQALYLNNNVAPLNDVRVRQAISYAVDKQDIMDFIADGHGTAIGSSMYPAFSKYFLDELTDYYATDIDKAKSLLAEAGYENGFDLEITVPGNYQPHIDTATVLVEQLAKIGIRCKIKTVEWETWKEDTYGARNYQATVCGFDASTLTASALLSRFVSTNPKNISYFSNEEYDEVYAKASTATNEAEQTELYKRLETILTEQAANAYIQDMCDLVAVADGIVGYEFYPLYVIDMSKIRYE